MSPVYDNYAGIYWRGSGFQRFNWMQGGLALDDRRGVRSRVEVSSPTAHQSICAEINMQMSKTKQNKIKGWVVPARSYE